MDEPTIELAGTEWPARPAAAQPAAAGLPQPFSVEHSPLSPRASTRPVDPSPPAAGGPVTPPGHIGPPSDQPRGPRRRSDASPSRQGEPRRARPHTPRALSAVGHRVRNTVSLLLAVAAVLAIAYIGLSATILAAGRIDGHWLLAGRNPATNGGIPDGTLVVTSSAAAPTNFLDRARQGLTGIPGAAVGQIIAAPNDHLGRSRTGMLTVNGVASHVAAKGIALGSRNPAMGYLMVCLAGACGSPGSALSVPVDQVIGKVFWQHGGTTLRGPDPTPSGVR